MQPLLLQNLWQLSHPLSWGHFSEMTRAIEQDLERVAGANARDIAGGRSRWALYLGLVLAEWVGEVLVE
jgi:hypothetical protein